MIFETIDGIKLNYQLRGQGKPIVLVEGFGSYQEIWTKQVEYLVQMGYQVITYDHRNFGRSQRTEKGHNLQQLTNDLIELMNYLHIANAVFIGHSMGGSVLYNLMQTKPKLIKLAIIIDQTPYMLNTPIWPYGFMNYAADNYLTETTKTPAIRETWQGLNNQVNVGLSNARVKYPFNRQDNLDLLQEHSRLDWRPVIETSPVKMVVFAAKHSPYYDYHFSDWMKEHGQQVETVVLDNCGHDIMAEVPERFNQLLRHFLLKNRYL